MHISFVGGTQSLFLHFFFSHSSLAWLHLFLISLCNFLYSIPYLGRVFCLLCIILRISSVIHSFFLLRPFSFRMISFADVIKAHLSASHFDFPLCSLYLLFTLFTYFSFRFESLRRLLYCNLGAALGFFRFCSFTLSLHITGQWLLLKSVLGKVLQWIIAFQNLLLIVM